MSGGISWTVILVGHSVSCRDFTEEILLVKVQDITINGRLGRGIDAKFDANLATLLVSCDVDHRQTQECLAR